MSEYIATTRIEHGVGKGEEPKVFKVGAKVTGLPKDVAEGFVASGAAVLVENPVKVEAEDPTVVRDTIMVMSGNYPPTIDRPAAVGVVPVRVVGADEAERIKELEKANKALRDTLNKEESERAEERARLEALEAENLSLRNSVNAQGAAETAPNAKTTDGPKS